MNNFEENKNICLFIVNLVSKLYHLGDEVLVEFYPASEFPFPEVTAMASRDYRVKFNIDRLKDKSIRINRVEWRKNCKYIKIFRTTFY